jgi:hypothetical protein
MHPESGLEKLISHNCAASQNDAKLDPLWAKMIADGSPLVISLAVVYLSKHEKESGYGQHGKQ